MKTEGKTDGKKLSFHVQRQPVFYAEDQAWKSGHSRQMMSLIKSSFSAPVIATTFILLLGLPSLQVFCKIWSGSAWPKSGNVAANKTPYF